MTERLYYENAYLQHFSAHVLTCTQTQKGWAVTLDRTAFYPEGGGQPGDTGVLGDVQVLDTYERDGAHIHLCAEPLPVSSAVEGQIDWLRRFDFMQQHSGEHIVSGLVYRKYGYHNVGFHMGAETVTVDLSGPLEEEQIAQIEAEANEIVWKNVPVQQAYPTEEELAATDFRSKKELHGWVRLIDIPGADCCACCGMHVAATGAIGLIKILSCVRFREGVRLEMICGKRAYDYVNLNCAQNRRISGFLSAKLHETSGHVQRLLEEKAALDYRMVGLERARYALLAEQTAGQSPALLFVPGLNADGVRQLCTFMMERSIGVCAAFSDTGAGFQYAVARLEPQDVKKMNETLNGRGGGKPGFAQGTLRASETEIRAWFEAL